MDASSLAERLSGWNSGSGPLYAELGAALRRLIASGVLLPGVRLPSERALAAALDVSRGTVTAAYDELRDADALRGRRGSGTVVSGLGLPGDRSRLRAGVSDALDTSVVSHALGEGAIDLRASCWMDDEGLPAKALEQASKDLRRALSGHGYRPAGITELRTAIAERYTDRGLHTSPDQILVTTGAQQAVQLVAQMALRPGDRVLVEDPTYLGALDAFALVGTRAVPMSAYSADDDPFTDERTPLCYVMAEVHNPTGRALGETERARLLARATEHGTLLVDDQAIAEIWLGGARPRSLAAMAEEAGEAARVVTVGSAGKVLWGGLRVGWIRAALPVIDTLTRLKAVADVGSPIPSQLIAARLFPSIDEILDTRLREVRRRRDLITKRLRAGLPDWSFTTPDGGLSLWIGIGADGRTFCAEAARAGVGLMPGSLCSAGTGFDDHIRLSYGMPADQLDKAVDRLRIAWSQHTTGSAAARYEIVV